MPDEKMQVLIVGISGCSSSGKTTLARLLRDIFPNSFILHEDDFYKPDAEIPISDGLQDWDCLEALSVADMESALRHIHTSGTFPVGIRKSRRLSARTDHGFSPPLPPSSEYALTDTQANVAQISDQNSVGACPVSEEKIEAMKQKVAAWDVGHEALAQSRIRLCFLDGFLLYAREMEAIMKLIDVKLFLLVSREKATQRRKDRDGYVTLEGFWKDPPGYVDKIVWPNYERAHAWLFEDGNVEGKPREDVMASFGIEAQAEKGLDADMASNLEWAVESIMAQVTQRLASQ